MSAPPYNLLLWLGPYSLLLLVMVHAMMEFTATYLVLRPQAHRKPLPAGELRRRLLAADESDWAYPLVEGKDCDLEMHWEEREGAPSRRLTVAKGSSSGHLRLLLDERRHELRVHQVTRSYYFFAGLRGWLPDIRGSAGFQAGPPGLAVTRQIGRIANQAGWSVRPVLWWFQATHHGHRVLEALTPQPLRLWPARRFWGILYPLSYFLAMAWFLLLGGAEVRTAGNLRLLLLISAMWWGAWAFLAWARMGLPRFWRKKHVG